MQSLTSRSLKSRRSAWAILLMIFAVGCVHNMGVDFSKIKPGKTTEQEVIAKLGEPEGSKLFMNKQGRKFKALYYIGFTDVASIFIDPNSKIVIAISKGPSGKLEVSDLLDSPSGR